MPRHRMGWHGSPQIRTNEVARRIRTNWDDGTPSSIYSQASDSNAILCTVLFRCLQSKSPPNPSDMRGSAECSAENGGSVSPLLLDRVLGAGDVRSMETLLRAGADPAEPRLRNRGREGERCLGAGMFAAFVNASHGDLCSNACHLRVLGCDVIGIRPPPRTVLLFKYKSSPE